MRRSVLRRGASAASVVAVVVVVTGLVGVPINSLPRFALWLGLIVWIALGRRRHSERATGIAAAVALVILVASHAVPAARIQEGHQVFLGDRRTAALEDALPAEVRDALAAEFLRTYPQAGWCDPATWGCWRSFEAVREVAAFSADGAFQRGVRYSRVVEAIDVRSLSSLRPGFANIVTSDGRSTSLNWWDPATDVRRDRMPFVVWYAFGEEAVGSSLCWSGQAFWPEAGGRYAPRRADTAMCRTIGQNDVGAPIYFSSIAASPDVSVRWQPAGTLVVWRLLRRGVTLFTAVCLAFICFRPTRSTWTTLLIMGASGALVTVMGWGASYVYYVQGGGGDGLIHAGFGRAILRHAADGEWLAALRGEEPLFYFMPGLRYLKALGYAVFGETNFFDLLVVLLLPAAWWALARQSGWGRIAAALAVAAFVVLVLPDYVESGLIYPEPAAALFLISGLAGLLAALRLDGPRGGGGAGGLVPGGLALATAFAVRPNVGAAILLVAIALGWHLARRRAWAGLVAFVLALSPCSALAWHNAAFGGQFVLMTGAVSIPENVRVPPGDYASVVSNPESRARVARHLTAGLFDLRGLLSRFAEATVRARVSRLGPYLQYAVAAAKLCVLLVMLGGLIGWRRSPLAINVLLLSSIGLLAPMLVYFNTERWAVLPWSVAAFAAAAILRSHMGARAGAPNTVGGAAAP